ncbi:MAG: hypothetical protein J0L98_13895 [Zoogloea sp.]|nr:hypothetical protein [Zoogloea sp.]
MKVQAVSTTLSGRKTNEAAQHRERSINVTKATIAIAALVLTLVVSNLWWAYRMFDSGITQTYARASQEATSEALSQTLAILPIVVKAGVTRNEIVSAARIPNDHTEPYEKEGYVWVGQLGLKFNPGGQFEKAIAGPEGPAQ